MSIDRSQDYQPVTRAVREELKFVLPTRDTCHLPLQRMHRDESQQKTFSFRGSLPIVFMLLLFVGSLGLIAFSSIDAKVTGTASLPNSVAAVVIGPFSCSYNTPTTEIEAGWHVFAFSPTSVTDDGVSVRDLDASVKKVEISSSYWDTSLRINGIDVLIER